MGIDSVEGQEEVAGLDHVWIVNQRRPVLSHKFEPITLGAVSEKRAIARLSHPCAIKIEAYSSENNYIQTWTIDAWRAYHFQDAGLKIRPNNKLHEHSSALEWSITSDGVISIEKTLYTTNREFGILRVEHLRGEEARIFMPRIAHHLT